MDGGNGNNTFNIINSSGSGNLTGGTGNDTFFIKNWTGTGDLHGGGGNDKFYFGTLSTTPGSGVIDVITKQHKVFGEGGTDTLIVDDSGAADLRHLHDRHHLGNR